MFSHPIDFKSFFTKGYSVATIDSCISDLILRQMKEESWIEFQPDDAGLDDSHEKYYQCRFMAARSLLQPQNPRPIYRKFAEDFEAYANNITRHYDNGKFYNMSAFCGRKGYKMDLHTDVGDRAIFDVIAYFGDPIESKDDGGYLEIYETDVLDPYGDSAKLIETIYPKHGLMVLLNNMNPSLYHKVVELKKDINRYQIIGNMGMENPPDWHYEYKESKGFVNESNPKSIDDFEGIVDLLNNRAL